MQAAPSSSLEILNVISIDLFVILDVAAEVPTLFSRHLINIKLYFIIPGGRVLSNINKKHEFIIVVIVSRYDFLRASFRDKSTRDTGINGLLGIRNNVTPGMCVYVRKRCTRAGPE